ncbi:MAG TPA: DUF1328 family protein [Bdellovibrionales bacterium]|nr:DUF1328 family protein [Bdellovibrionales bacterium]
MLNAAIAFFLIGLLAMLFGANGIAGLSMEAGRLLLIVFVVLAVISFLVSLLRGKKPALAIAFMTLSLGAGAVAETTAAEKAENAAQETKTGMKKAGRKVKKAFRDMTGNESVKEDVKDSVKNTGDEMGDATKKAENKVD